MFGFMGYFQGLFRIRAHDFHIVAGVNHDAAQRIHAELVVALIGVLLLAEDLGAVLQVLHGSQAFLLTGFGSGEVGSGLHAGEVLLELVLGHVGAGADHASVLIQADSFQSTAGTGGTLAVTSHLVTSFMVMRM